MSQWREGTWTARDVTGSGLVYEALILPPSGAMECDAADQVIELTGSVMVVGGTDKIN